MGIDLQFKRHSRFGVRKSIRHLVWVGVLGLAGSAVACKYNVRDVGFVDWDPAPYRLMAFVGEGTDVSWVNSVRYTAAASFLEANVELSLRESPAHALLEQYSVDRLPALVLVAPDDRSLPIRLDPSEESAQAAIWEALEGVVTSPQREALLSRVVEAYAVVLVAEGSDSAANLRARQAAASAVERIGGLLDRLPKVIKTPPEVLVLNHETAVKEQVLLWSLGVEQADEPSVAVVYGRARRVGPLLQGPLVTETAIYRALAVLGQDCECDLDRAWMTGPLAPVRWGRDQQEAVQRLAGFDAESPMIKVEISRIVARGPSANARTVGLPSAGGGLDFDVLGYSEVSVDELTTAEEEPTPQPVEPETEPSSGNSENSASSSLQAVAAPPASALSEHRPWGMVAVVGIGVVCLGGGALLLWRRQRD